MRCFRLTLLLLCAVPFGATSVSAQGPITIYVGPAERGGFIDTDKGVRDSIKDIQHQMRKRKQYKLVETPETARLRLYVVRRGKGNTNRGVAVPVGGVTALFSGESVWVEAVLRVDDYERQMSGADDSQWGDAAGRLANDLDSWVAANKARLQ